jgi:tRNA(Arg) A34 adenosine deaminase TadA
MNFGSINGGFNFFQTKNCNHVPEIYDSISKIQCENLINDFFKDKRP